jgi:hypothetical protein
VEARDIAQHRASQHSCFFSFSFFLIYFFYQEEEGYLSTETALHGGSFFLVIPHGTVMFFSSRTIGIDLRGCGGIIRAEMWDAFSRLLVQHVDIRSVSSLRMIYGIRSW